jgi:hypothetical protein
MSSSAACIGYSIPALTSSTKPIPMMIAPNAANAVSKYTMLPA